MVCIKQITAHKYFGVEESNESNTTNVSPLAEFITATLLYSVMKPEQGGLRERMNTQYQTGTSI